MEKSVFERSQMGWLMIILYIPLELWLVISFVSHWGTRPLGIIIFTVLSVVFLAITLLFYRLKVTIDQQTIKVTMGVGLFRFTFKTEEVESVSLVKNSWLYGWGIRYIPNGRLYNVSGLKAVELKFKGRNEIRRIGFDNCEELKRQIEKRITKG